MLPDEKGLVPVPCWLVLAFAPRGVGGDASMEYFALQAVEYRSLKSGYPPMDQLQSFRKRQLSDINQKFL